jgi:glycosyltransferase involved in cell wall biosynthesis
MRVLFVVENLSIKKNTGVASTAISLARCLAQNHEIELVAPTALADLEETAGFLQGLVSHLFPQPPLLPRTTVPALGQFIENELTRFDLVHLHGLWRYPQWVAARTARRFGIPYIVSPHGMCEPFELARKAWKKKLYFNLVERQTLQNAAAIHAITEAERTHCTQLQFSKSNPLCSTQPIHVIPHGVEMLPFLSPGAIARHLPPSIATIPSTSPILLFMGRLHPKKGLDLLIPAFAQVLKHHPSAHLVLAGPNAGHQGNLERLAESLGVAFRVLFPGMVTGIQKQAMLQRADLFTLPSYSEGFSVAILEALAAAKPVVITKFCYFDEVITAQCGRVVETNVAALAQALNQILDLNPLSRVAMGRQGQQLIERRYTWANTAAQMTELYQSVLQSDRKVMVSTAH